MTSQASREQQGKALEPYQIARRFRQNEKAKYMLMFFEDLKLQSELKCLAKKSLLLHAELLEIGEDLIQRREVDQKEVAEDKQQQGSSPGYLFYENVAFWARPGSILKLEILTKDAYKKTKKCIGYCEFSIQEMFQNPKITHMLKAKIIKNKENKEVTGQKQAKSDQILLLGDLNLQMLFLTNNLGTLQILAIETNIMTKSQVFLTHDKTTYQLRLQGSSKTSTQIKFQITEISKAQLEVGLIIQQQNEAQQSKEIKIVLDMANNQLLVPYLNTRLSKSFLLGSQEQGGFKISFEYKFHPLYS